MFAKKKRIDIYGTLEFPLAIGCAAFIKKQEGDPIRTSSVKRFITLPYSLQSDILCKGAAYRSPR